MAMKGRKAKPAVRHAAEGTTAKKGKLVDLFGAPAPDRLPPAPKYMPKEAREFWKKNVKHMRDLGVLAACDMGHLESSSMFWFRLREANRTLIKEGLFIPDHHGITKRHPAAIEAFQMTEKLRMWYAEVGFTPAARAALGGRHVPAKGEEATLAGRVFGKGTKK